MPASAISVCDILQCGVVTPVIAIGVILRNDYDDLGLECRQRCMEGTEKSGLRHLRYSLAPNHTQAYLE